MSIITFDFETKSYADLKKVGAWCYAEHPTTEIICACYGIGGAPVQSWWPGKELTGVQAWNAGETSFYQNFPRDLCHALSSGMPIEAWNVGFEKAIWYNIAVVDFDWPELEDTQWRDTMAVACYYAMPAGLDQCARALGMGGKNPDGARLITKYSKLCNKTAHDLKVKRENQGLPHIPDHEWVEWRDMTKTERDANPGAKEDGGYYNEDFSKWIEYCADDVRQEQDVSDFLGDLPDDELELFFLDQKINRRGIALDEVSINNARFIAEKRSQELANDFEDLTGLKPSQTQQIMKWISKQGYELDNLQADYLQEIVEGDNAEITLKGDALEAIKLRLKYNKASTKKLDAMLRQRARDGRAKFQVRYHGAGTGRWTGTGFQPLNLVKSYEAVPPERLIRDISHRDPEFLDRMYGDAMEAVSKASRHHIIATPGHRIMAADFVSIEAVLLACLAEEQWKIDAFRRGDPIYELMGCKIHRLGDNAVALAMDNKKAFKDEFPDERFDGKTGELAFGYQGSVGAWRKFDTSDRHTDEAIVEICRGWRSEHPATTTFWKDLEWAAIDAVRHPGAICEVGPIAFEIVDEWLAMHLPDGKRIWYFDPQLVLGWPQWHKPEEYEDCADGSCDCRQVTKLTYMAQKEGQWRRTYTYGGKLAENATQATSRQVLTPAMLRLEEAGYPIILSVYDEIVCEVPDNFGDLNEFQDIMRSSPGAWAKNWPINVDAWEGERYKK